MHVPRSGRSLDGPAGPTDPSGHHSLPWVLLARAAGPFPDVWGALRDELEDCEPERAVVSSEFFSWLDDEATALVADELSGFDVDVVVYLRRPTEFVASLYRYGVGSGQVSLPFDRFVDEVAGMADYDAIVGSWSAAFGAEAVQVRDYAAAADDVVGDLLGYLDVEVEVEVEATERAEAARVHVSPDRATTRLLRVVNRAGELLPGVPASVAARLRHRVRASHRVVAGMERILPWLGRPLWASADRGVLARHERAWRELVGR